MGPRPRLVEHVDLHSTDGGCLSQVRRLDTFDITIEIEGMRMILTHQPYLSVGLDLLLEPQRPVASIYQQPAIRFGEQIL